MKEFILGLAIGPLLLLFCLFMLVQMAVLPSPEFALQSDIKDIISFRDELGWRLTNSSNQENLYISYTEIPKKLHMNI